MSFFFQAEDGIRDHCVTGVQTCALPISSRRPAPRREAPASSCGCRREPARPPRSEERRVGKERRSRRSTYQQRLRQGFNFTLNFTLPSPIGETLFGGRKARAVLHCFHKS